MIRSVAEMVEKRRKRWNERQDIEYDRLITEAAAREVLSDPTLRQEIAEKPYLLIELCFTIVDKNKRTVPFFLNEVQRDFIKKLEENGTIKPYFILKGRQQGFTSVITAIQLCFAIVQKNFSGFTLADRNDNTGSIFNDKARMVYARLPDILKPTEKFNSRNELFFDKLNSSWRIATATGDVGRSRTLNFVHFSEIAFYDCSLSDLQAGIGEAMTADAIKVYETTANGWGESKDLWDSGACVNLFYEWWRTPEYTCDDYSYIKKADRWLTERIKLLEDYGLSKQQIAWYCRKYAGYLDKRLIRQEYPITPEEAFISSGNCVFDTEAVTNALAALVGKSEGRRGIFTYERVQERDKDTGEVLSSKLTNIKFSESKDGYIVIHKEPENKKDNDGNIIKLAPYVLGGDTSGLGDDFYTGKIINNITGRTAATLRVQRIDEDIYAEQMLCLAKYYNNALIAIETNYSRQPTRIIEQKYGYINLYKRERLDKTFDEVQQITGFETTRTTKPIIIQNLVEKVRSDATVECDGGTLREMLTFVRKENGSTEAVNGMHDDLVMALAIAHFCGKQQTTDYIKVERSEPNWISNNFNMHREGDTYIDWS